MKGNRRQHTMGTQAADNRVSAFIRCVQDSTLLSDAEKATYLDRPELLPESYRTRVVRILTAYEQRNEARYHTVQQRIDGVLEKSIAEIESSGLPDNEKRTLIGNIISGHAQLT